jgi:tripartite-type tricarboxylate transporter receptor subunit TctC
MKTLVAALAAVAFALPAAAQTWPQRPVTMVVTFAAGTTPDVVARLVAPHLERALGQPVVIENRAGAGGNIGADSVAKAQADGHTLLVGTNGPAAINKLLYTDITYDSDRDLRPVTLFVRAPQMLVVRPDVPAQTMQEFVAYAKANPGAMDYATTGAGSASHLTMELLKADAGLQIEHVPYRGFPLAMQDMLGGQIEAMFAIASGMLGNVREGKVRALAVTADRPFALAPDIPTVVQAGFPNLESYAWIGLLAPAGTPDAVVQRLQQEVAKVLAMPDVNKTLVDQGYQVVGNTPAEFGAYIREEQEKWGAVIRATGARVE